MRFHKYKSVTYYLSLCIVLTTIAVFGPEKVIATHSHVSVLSISWSPNGNNVALGLTDGTVRIIDPTTGERLMTLVGHSEEVFAVEWNSDGTLIASGGPDSLLNIWEADSGKLFKSISVTSNTVSADIFSVSWSPDGREIAIGTNGSVLVYDVKTGVQKKSLLKHRAYVLSVDWNREDMLVSGSWDGTIAFWDLIEGTTMCQLPETEARTSGVETLDWLPSENLIASGHLDSIIRVWDTSSGLMLHEIEAHTKSPVSVVWNPDGTRIASGGLDGTIHIWSIDSEESSLLFQEEEVHVYDIAWSPDGSLLASGHAGGYLRIWDMATMEMITVILIQ